MANFEALIKQALNTQNSQDPKVREKIYTSSRNALRRMLEKSGNQPIESMKAHMRNLEACIARIELEYAPIGQVKAPVIPQPAQPPQQTPQQTQSAPIQEPRIEPQLEPRVVPQAPARQVQAQQVQANIPEPSLLEPTPVPESVPQPIQQPAPEPVYESVEVPPPAEELPQYKRTNPFMRRIGWLLFIVAGLAVALWLLYALSSAFDNSTEPRNTGQNLNSASQDEQSKYITLIDPNDPSALITAGRGSATLVNELNVDLLRIQSIRQNGTGNVADPILLELQQGVLNQIAGKDITVEIKVKSGDQKNATFSVSCDFAGVSACGRKRFQAGLQPVDVIFALRMPSNVANGNAFLAINTDVTSQANATGVGDKIDIVYARVRMAK